MLHTKGDTKNSQKFLESALKLHKKFHGTGSVQVWRTDFMLKYLRRIKFTNIKSPDCIHQIIIRFTWLYGQFKFMRKFAEIQFHSFRLRCAIFWWPGLWLGTLISEKPWNIRNTLLKCTLRRSALIFHSLEQSLYLMWFCLHKFITGAKMCILKIVTCSCSDVACFPDLCGKLHIIKYAIISLKYWKIYNM